MYTHIYINICIYLYVCKYVYKYTFYATVNIYIYK